MPDKISLTYVTQSSSPLAAFVDFSAASAWPILLSPSRAIRSQLHARRFPLPQNTSVHSALACPVATATSPQPTPRCHARLASPLWIAIVKFHMKNIAFVIGISEYVRLQRLPASKADGLKIEELLKATGKYTDIKPLPTRPTPIN